MKEVGAAQRGSSVGLVIVVGTWKVLKFTILDREMGLE
jgi:hypothetical protein